MTSITGKRLWNDVLWASKTFYRNWKPFPIILDQEAFKSWNQWSFNTLLNGVSGIWLCLSMNLFLWVYFNIKHFNPILCLSAEIFRWPVFWCIQANREPQAWPWFQNRVPYQHTMAGHIFDWVNRLRTRRQNVFRFSLAALRYHRGKLCLFLLDLFGLGSV